MPATTEVRPKIRVVSDGTKVGTKVYDVETGELIKDHDNLTKVQFTADATIGYAQTILTFVYWPSEVQFEFEGDVVQTKNNLTAREAQAEIELDKKKRNKR